MRDQIKYGEQSWDYTYLTKIEIVDPCLNTKIKGDSKIADFEYEITAPLLRKSFLKMTDSFGDTITKTFPNACGAITYIARNADTEEVYGWAKISDNNSTHMYLDIETEYESLIAEYNMKIVGSMTKYPK